MMQPLSELFLRFLTLFLLTTVVGMANISLEVGSVVVSGDDPTAAGDEEVRVPIFVSGGDAITDLEAYFQIGDGGPLFGGTPGPRITAIDFTGSIWESSSGFAVGATFTGDPNPQPTQLEEVFVSLDVSGETVPASGLLCTLVIDVSGFPTGTFDLRVAAVVPPENTTSTTFSNGGSGVPANLVNGTLELVEGEPPPTAETPQLSILRLASGVIELGFPSVNGASYTIQWNPGLEAAGWQSLSPALVGDGSTLSWQDDGSQTGSLPPAPGSRFYRVVVD